jgi:hypothetical protein
MMTMPEKTAWWAGGDDEGMPDVVKRWMREPDPGDPPYDWRRVEILFDALTKLPPRDFAEWRDRALEEGHEHEWNAAQGMAVEYINDQRETHPPGSPQFLDAMARADELQRLTIGD